jgi:hypothetical protein
MTYKIFKLDLARQLIDAGFFCVEVNPNREKPWLNVYGFEDSPELREFVENYKKS